jgi:beta-galactosidase
VAFPYEDLDRRPPGTWRSSDLRPHGQVSILVDAAQVGVGGDTAWSEEGRAHGKYRIALAPLTYGFTIEPSDFRDDRAGADGLADLLGPDAGKARR